MFYFLYKPLYIANVGGYLPKPIKGVDLGLAVREGYYLGKTDDYEKLKDIKEFVICVIDEDTAEGFGLLGVEKLPKEGTDFRREEELRDLTPEEKEKQRKARRLVDKLKLRRQLDVKIQDVPDCVADNARLIKWLFYLIGNLFESLPKTYKNRCNKNVLDMIGIVQNAVDNNKMTEKELYRLLQRQNDIFNIVSSYKSEYEEGS